MHNFLNSKPVANHEHYTLARIHAAIPNSDHPARKIALSYFALYSSKKTSIAIRQNQIPNFIWLGIAVSLLNLLLKIDSGYLKLKIK